MPLDIVDDRLEVDPCLTDGVKVDVDRSDFESDDSEPEEIQNDSRFKEKPDSEPSETQPSTSKEKSPNAGADTGVLLNQLLKEKLKQMSAEEIKQMLADKGSVTDKETEEVVSKNKTTTVKSPSDITLYQPVFSKRTPEQNLRTPIRSLQFPVHTNSPPALIANNLQKQVNGEDDIINRISHFVESIHMEQSQATSPPAVDQRQVIVRQVEVPGIIEACKKVDNKILEVEKFKASIEPPKGMLSESNIICLQQ